MRFILTGGQPQDGIPALERRANFKAGYVLADKGYDSDIILAAIKQQGAIPVIPPKANRNHQRAYDKTIYKARNVIERTFNKLKQYRRLATRYERKSQHFLALLYLATLSLWVT